MNNFYKAAIACSLIPMIGGTLIFFIFLLTESESLYIAGLLNIGVGVILFFLGIVFVYLSAKKFKSDGESYRLKILFASFFLFINFPIALSYASYVESITTMHTVIIVNNSDARIDRITFIDPAKHQYQIEKISPHSQIKERFNFKGEGSVEYIAEMGQAKKNGLVFSYITGGLSDIAAIEILPDGEIKITAGGGR